MPQNTVPTVHNVSQKKFLLVVVCSIDYTRLLETYVVILFEISSPLTTVSVWRI